MSSHQVANISQTPSAEIAKPTKTPDWGFTTSSRITGFKTHDVAAQLESSNSVFWDTVARLDAIDPRAVLSVDNHKEPIFDTIPAGTKHRSLGQMAYARLMVLFLNEFGQKWTPPWPDKTNGKYRYHPEAIQRTFVFLTYLGKFKIIRPNITNSMKITPIVYSMGTFATHAPTAPTAANVPTAAGVPSGSAFLPEIPMSRMQLNQLYEERLSFLEMRNISSDSEADSDAAGGDPKDKDDPDYVEPRSSLKSKGKKPATTRRIRDDSPDLDEDFVSRRVESSRPSLDGFPHLTSDAQRNAVIKWLINAGLEMDRLPVHLRTGADFEAPAYDANTAGALRALGLDSTDESLNRLVKSAVAHAAGTDYGLGLVTDEYVPTSAGTPTGTDEFADALQDLDRAADSGPMSYLDSCTLLGLDPKEPSIANELVNEKIDLKPHQVGGAANVVHWYHCRKDVRAAAVCDDAGTGKTRLAISTLHFIAQETKSALPDIYKPFLVLCPSILVTNWAREFLQFRGILKVFSFIGDDERESRIITHVGHLSNNVMATAFRPGGLFDPKSPKTADCVVLCSYSTWASRTLYDRIAFEQRVADVRLKSIKAVSYWSGMTSPPAVGFRCCLLLGGISPPLAPPAGSRPPLSRGWGSLLTLVLSFSNHHVLYALLMAICIGIEAQKAQHRLTEL